MTLYQAIIIFEAFDTWCRLPNIGPFAEYSRAEVLEAQRIILSTVKQSLFYNTENN